MESNTFRRVSTLSNDSSYREYHTVSLGISEALSKLDGDDEKEREEVMEALPWSFRFNTGTGFFEILQEENLVAITQDNNFADQVCEMFNRLTLIKETFTEEIM